MVSCNPWKARFEEPYGMPIEGKGATRSAVDYVQNKSISNRRGGTGG